MIITTGVPEGPVVSRQEIHAFLKDKDLTNIFILAMEAMMKISQEKPTSWYQIGSIHGRPFIPYDGVGATGEMKFGGYCCHSSTLFPPWHRPYIALLEQMLWKHAQDIANKFEDPEDKERYRKAAERFRFPYWDWATDANLPDLVATASRVVVHRPDGTHEEVSNPLYAYKFNPVYEYFGDGHEKEAAWESWPTTVRYPSSESATAISKSHEMQKTLENNRLCLRDRAYNILTQVDDWHTFSHDTSGGAKHQPGDRLDNIESLHNQIHVLAGEGGHMGEVDYAAYDPVFWMHHANVDRLFALWQALHPDKYVTPACSTAQTFTRDAYEAEDSKSPLTPFRRTAHTFWDADGVRDTRVFRYTYPELEKWGELSREKKAKLLHMHINKLYGHSAPVSAAKPSMWEKLNTHKTGIEHHIAHGQHIRPSGNWHSEAKHDKHEYFEWFADIEVEKYSLSSSFKVHLFLGDYPADPKKWGWASSLVGSHCIFANNIKTTGCSRCLDSHNSQKKVRGSLPLTSALASRLEGLDNLNPEKVMPYVQKNFHWKVQKRDGTVIPNEDVPGLKVTVCKTVVECPDGPEHFPKWRKPEVHGDATSGRHGGHH